MTEPMTVRDRRQAFVDNLYARERGTRSKNPKYAGDCRQALARMRRMFSGTRQQTEAFEYVFPYDPPQAEQDTWLLVAGLFALNPQPPRSRKGRRTFGASMGELKAKTGTAADRRFTQLLARDRDALSHHLRQTVRLLASHGIPIDHHQLLDDLVVLLGENYRGDHAHQIRLNWARDYHVPARNGRSTEAVADNDDEEPEPGDAS
ncbi:CRISPR system Cascade subunit CasB [Saccharothrix saharensis]|uniref:CRISPR system Cascade subunit CasB n=1 Tax=Saccharothrix saharensis TaxID=571190 RepID=A0A543J5W7_9PSEU|nr:type I-E CRISPR-associated protein Cse2/CasB [Saccharothrix saharensis]TQM78178.1 CRISPR system Cascade subunit CasB [Saccharothrix saharensis]